MVSGSECTSGDKSDRFVQLGPCPDFKVTQIELFPLMHVKAQGHECILLDYIYSYYCTPVLTQGYDLQGISQPKLDLSVQELAQPLRMNL